jgi:hypothetical protein
MGGELRLISRESLRDTSLIAQSLTQPPIHLIVLRDACYWIRAERRLSTYPADSYRPEATMQHITIAVLHSHNI